nr:hypothetical protein CFP56_09098 [Quercus suber]
MGLPSDRRLRSGDEAHKYVLLRPQSIKPSLVAPQNLIAGRKTPFILFAMLTVLAATAFFASTYEPYGGLD